MKVTLMVLSVYVMILCPITTNAQINVHSDVEVEPKIEKVTYDSTLNFPGTEPESLIGQQIYLLPTYSARKEIVGYTKFRQNPTTTIDRSRPQRTYYLYSEGSGPFGGNGSNPNLMSNRYYDVIDIIRQDNRTFLKLLDIERDTEMYFLYPSDLTIQILGSRDRQFNDSWPFIVV